MKPHTVTRMKDVVSNGDLDTDIGRWHGTGAKWLLCRGKKRVTGVLLKCLEMQRWTEQLLNRQWLNTNEHIPYTKTRMN